VVIIPETWTGHDIFHARCEARFAASKQMKEKGRFDPDEDADPGVIAAAKALARADG
jgi:hypothetical protein